MVANPSALMQLVQAIGARDTTTAVRLLRAAPELASASAEAGATRQEAESYYFELINHYVYAGDTALHMAAAAHNIELVNMLLDISERKEVEEASLANDARLQDLSGNGPLAAFELDFAGEVFWFSPAWEKLLGYDEEDLGSDRFIQSAMPKDA